MAKLTMELDHSVQAAHNRSESCLLPLKSAERFEVVRSEWIFQE